MRRRDFAHILAAGAQRWYLGTLDALARVPMPTGRNFHEYAKARKRMGAERVVALDEYQRKLGTQRDRALKLGNAYVLLADGKTADTLEVD